jgi:hypothetical protein
MISNNPEARVGLAYSKKFLGFCAVHSALLYQGPESRVIKVIDMACNTDLVTVLLNQV